MSTKIFFDSDNYMSFSFIAGASPDEEEYFSDEKTDEAQDLLEGLLTGGMKDGTVVEWDTDPLEFAASLEHAARWFREVAAKTEGPLPFHIRVDID